ncbi:hypothetical protein BY996DRAFT_6418436 [Phakopsora pachyrhizi]|nr:hypothetical protein BY996DRAFT_6418436 [Phakopsora pachyrhizi]
MFEFACFLMDVVKELSGEDKEEKKLSEKLQSNHSEERQKRKSVFSPSVAKAGPIYSGGGGGVTNSFRDNDMEKMDLMHEAILLLQKLANCRQFATETINLALGSPELKGASDFPDVGLTTLNYRMLWVRGFNLVPN